MAMTGRCNPIRPARVSDAEQITEIYNHYVLRTHITFEEQPVDTASMAQRIRGIVPSLPWLVWEERQVLGYAYATKWKDRSAYRNSVESTVYLRSDAFGNGIGTRLYEALVAELCNLGLHSVVGGIALPNAASIALHEKLGFTKIGHFQQVGRKFERWIDVGYWQRLL